MIISYVRNYETITLFLRTHAGVDDNFESTWPGVPSV